MITPATHPTHFRKVTFPEYGYSYWTPRRYSLRIQEALQQLSIDFLREFYRKHHAEELKDGAIDETLLKKWIADNNTKETREYNRLYLIEKAKVFLTPIDGAPAVDSEEFWDSVTDEEMNAIFSFTTPMSENKNGEQSTSADSSAASPDSPPAL